MNEEHKIIYGQKKSQQKKAILITFLSVLVILLLILVAVIFLPDKNTAPAANTSSGNSSNTSSVTSGEKSDTISGNSSKDESVLGETSSDISFDTSSSDVSSDTSEPAVLKHGWVINNLGYTYIYGDTGLEQFNATAGTATRYAANINAIAAKMPEGVKVYNLLAPTNVDFVTVPREIYTADNFYNASQEKNIASINEQLDKGVIGINVYNTIKTHINEYLYFRTDINWTSLAAYYAYCDFAAAAGFSPISLNDYSKQTYDKFLGRFYTATAEESLGKNPDTLEYYLTDKNNTCKMTIYNNGVTYNSYKVSGNDVTASANGYNVFLGMDAEYFKITTGSSGKKLLIVSDTSAAAFIPYLVSHYSEIHYVNPNYYDENVSKFAADKKIDEVLFLSYVTNANRSDYNERLNGVNK